jgi:hypothetical protein
MYLEVSYLLVASGGLAVGAALGYFFGIRLYELRRIRRILKIKNPDFWDLEHFAIVEQAQEETAKKENWNRARENTGALERRNRVRVEKIPDRVE